MPPRLGERLHEAARRLLEARAADGLDVARLQAELLYGEAAGWDRARVIAAGSDAPEPATLSRFEQLLERGLRQEPLAYILGRREFYSLTFEVGPGVLVPRPETETLVEAALAAVREHPSFRRQGRAVRIVDAGTGCGAVAFAVARHEPAAHVIATDSSAAALAYAGRNRRRLGLQERVTMLTGDLLDPVTEPLDVVVANLPYIPTAEYEALPPVIREYEPREAVDGGADGLDVIRALIERLPSHVNEDSVAVLLEIGAGQAVAVSELLADAVDGETRTHRDLFGMRRVVEARRGYGWPADG